VSDQPPDRVRWLVMLLAMLARTFLTHAAQEYPEARGKVKCPKCQWRFEA
jgi:hypothetical protein